MEALAARGEVMVGRGDVLRRCAARERSAAGRRMADDLLIRRLAPGEDCPWNLLLLADPSREEVEAYLTRGHCYLGLAGGQVVGEFVLLETAPQSYELMNVALIESCQGRGWGKRLVEAAIGEARRMGAARLAVCTGNSSLTQLAVYQKCGFRIVGVERDYYQQRYAEEIVENGIRCLDRIRLERSLED